MELSHVMRTIQLAISVLLIGMAGIAAAQAPRQSGESKAPATQAPAAIRPIPPEMSRHFQAIYPKLQPSAKAWIDQQARMEAYRSSLDVAELNAAVRTRFANSNSNLSDMDIDAVVAIVMFELAQSDEKDLQNMMNQMQAANSQKQEIREFMDEIKRDELQNAKQNQRALCASALCKALPARLATLRAAAGKLPRPVNLPPPEPHTYGDLARIGAGLQNALDSTNEMSDELQIRLQMLMQRRTQALETISNIMKTTNDTSNAIIANLK
jgi:DNA repair exonuclease SbcCD ATPase subunit